MGGWGGVSRGRQRQKAKKDVGHEASKGRNYEYDSSQWEERLLGRWYRKMTREAE